MFEGGKTPTREQRQMQTRPKNKSAQNDSGNWVSNTHSIQIGASEPICCPCSRTKGLGRQDGSEDWWQDTPADSSGPKPAGWTGSRAGATVLESKPSSRVANPAHPPISCEETPPSGVLRLPKPLICGEMSHSTLEKVQAAFPCCESAGRLAGEME